MSDNSSPNKLIDVHHHFITSKSLEAFQKTYPKELFERFNSEEAKKRFGSLPDPETLISNLTQDMVSKGVDHVLPMTFAGEEKSGFLAHKKYPTLFPGTIPMLLPSYHTDPSILDEWKEKGAVAVKFYPGFWGFPFSDDRIKPYLEKIMDLDLGIIIHFGVMKGGDVRNIWPSNPLELKPWLQTPKFKELKFIMAHFGAGYLREILMMGYAFPKNIAVDTSGSNDWLFHSPWTDLTQVLQKLFLRSDPRMSFLGQIPMLNLSGKMC